MLLEAAWSFRVGRSVGALFWDAIGGRNSGPKRETRTPYCTALPECRLHYRGQSRLSSLDAFRPVHASKSGLAGQATKRFPARWPDPRVP